MDELFRRFEVKDEKNLDKFKDLVCLLYTSDAADDLLTV